MNIVVLIKQTFDTEEKIKVENKRVSEDGVQYVINPYDEYAVEEAIKLRDEHGGEVTVLTVGPERSESALRTALAMGADRAILVDDEGQAGDEYSTARIIAAALKDRTCDILLGGHISIDNGSGQVCLRVAELLQIPSVSAVTKLEVRHGTVFAERDMEGDLEKIEVSLPVLVTAQQGLNEPRYPSLPNIMKAKKKPLDRVTIADLHLSHEDVKSRTTAFENYLPNKKTAGRLLSGPIPEQAKQLVQLLRNEAQVI